MIRPLHAVAAVALLCGGGLAALALSDEIAGRVSHVRDGDTLEIGRTAVRLWGIDCPELSEPGGSAARDLLARLALNRAAACERMGPDSYGRRVARCWVRGADVAALLVEARLCTDWPEYSGGHYGRTR